jgi:hypothetical protein
VLLAADPGDARGVGEDEDGLVRGGGLEGEGKEGNEKK